MSKLKVYSESKHGVPAYAKEGDSGLDLAANLERSVFIPPLGRALIPTGIYCKFETGYEGLVRPKSGNSLKQPFNVQYGTVDGNYIGEIGVVLQNVSEKTCEIKDGQFVAQLVVAPVDYAVVETVESKDELGESERGADGFGSTGATVTERKRKSNKKVKDGEEITE